MEKRQGMTPFQYLSANIGKIKFKCENKYKSEYRRALAKVLKRMDRYFIDNKLYDAVDFWPAADRMIESDFFFEVDYEAIANKRAGVHHRGAYGWAEKIGIAPEYLGKMTETEGVLCHELMHYLTVGQKVIHYYEGGKKYEVSSNMVTWKSSGSGFGMSFAQGDIAKGGFFCEGWTELSKQEIYTEKECHHSYLPQTKFIQFLDCLTATKFSIKNFLRMDINVYNSLKDFEMVKECCHQFQKKFKENYKIDYTTDETYLMAQDLAVKAAIRNILLSKTADKGQILRTCSVILQGAPSYHGGRREKYKADVESALTIYAEDMPQLLPEHKHPYAKLLIDTSEKKGLLDSGRVRPSASSKFEFKTEPHEIWYNGSKLCSFDAIVGNRDTKFMMVQKGTNISIESDWTGHGLTLVAQNEKGQSDVLQIQINPENFNEIMVAGQNRKINIATYKKKLEKNVQIQSNLVLRPQLLDDIQKIIDQHSPSKIQNMKVVNLENGEEYLIVSTVNNVFFYQIVDGDCKQVQVTKKKEVEDSISVSDKFYTSNDKHALVGYHNTSIYAGDGDTLYELENGLVFTSYFTEGEQFAPVIPFGSSGNLIAERRPCDEVYNVGNELLAKMFKQSGVVAKGEQTTIDEETEKI